MAKAIYNSRGEAINYKNISGADIAAGDIVSLTTRIGVAAADIPNGAEGALHVTGVFEMPKSSAAIDLGAAVYYNAADGTVSATESDIPAGYAVSAATANDITVLVKLLG